MQSVQSGTEIGLAENDQQPLTKEALDVLKQFEALSCGDVSFASDNRITHAAYFDDLMFAEIPEYDVDDLDCQDDD